MIIKTLEDNENFKLLWGSSMRTNKKMDHNRSDNDFVHKQNVTIIASSWIYLHAVVTES